MSLKNERDPRAILVREKYFSLRPKPLERWIWGQRLPQAAERVFWLHWEEGMRQGDWCSELSLRQVARECCLDTSTVTRAYQALKRLGLIERQDPGRDSKNPFQQAIAITEVRVPKDLLVTLGRAPNRPARVANPAQNPRDEEGNPVLIPQADAANIDRPRISRVQTQALMQRLSSAERNAFFIASRDRKSSMPFDDNSTLSDTEQRQVLTLLATISTSDTAATGPARSAAVTVHAKPRHLTLIEIARLRKKVFTHVAASAAEAVFSQVLWSLEEGDLRRFELPWGINIALKKIREGTWTRPNRMPAIWQRRAVPETCSAA